MAVNAVPQSILAFNGYLVGIASPVLTDCFSVGASKVLRMDFVSIL